MLSYKYFITFKKIAKINYISNTKLNKMGNILSNRRPRRRHMMNANYRARVGGTEEEKPVVVPSAAAVAYDDCDDDMIDFNSGNSNMILMLTTCCASVCTLIVLLVFILYSFTVGLD